MIDTTQSTPDTGRPTTDDRDSDDSTSGATDANAVGGSGPDGTDRVRVPERDRPHVCTYCGDPFKRERQLALHRGLEHYGDLADEERAAFDEAYADENAEIRRFRIIALGALVLLYFAFLFAYAFLAL